MKRMALVGAAGAMCVLLAVPGLAYAPKDPAAAPSGPAAQAGQQDKDKRQAKQKEKVHKRRAEARPSRAPRQERRTKAERRAQEAQQRTIWSQHVARHWASQHRTWRQRGAYAAYRIPESYFRLHYGSSHRFRVYRLPFIYVAGHPRFQYAGYWFAVLDPIPEYWGPGWYEDDDVYVVYVDDGYYLFNRRWPHRPGVAITIAIQP